MDALDAFPITINCLVGLATFGAFHKFGLSGKVLSSRFVILAVISLGLSGWFDSLCTHEYTTRDSGAVIITGASSGIGRSAAIALANKGYDVYAGVRKEKDAESIRGEKISKLHPIIMDVVKSDQIEAAVKTIEATGMPVVALVNNAGIASNLPIEVNPVAKWRQLFDVNVFGVVECTQNFLPLLRKYKGRIVNIGSIAGDIGGLPGWTPYTPSKHALEAVSDALRNELADYDVSVSLIKPGAIRTDIWGKMHLSDKKVKPDFAAVAKKNIDENGRGSAEVKALYYEVAGNVFEAGWEVDNNPSTPGTDLTDTAIVHAITSKFPKTRYLVAPDAHVFYVLDHFLPDRVLDRLYHWLSYEGGIKLTHAK